MYENPEGWTPGELVVHAHSLAHKQPMSDSDIKLFDEIERILVEEHGIDPIVAKNEGRIEFLMYGDAYTFYQEPIKRAFMAFRMNLNLRKDKPLIVDIYNADLLLLHRVVLNGHVTLSANDLLLRKAATVAFTGRRIPDAIEAAKDLGVTLLGGWVPAGRGTDFWGASPFKTNGAIELIVSVSGQNHQTIDQPFADLIVEEFGKIERIAIG